MNRLRSYRLIEGINQQELGKALGVTGAMVSAMESGRRAFHGDLMTIGYDSKRLAIPDMSTPLHRQRASTTAAATARAQELLRLAGELFNELRDRTERAPKLSLERMTAQSLDDLEDIALDVRCSLQHEEGGPIRNLTAAVERAGVCLIPVVGLPGIDGISAWVDGTPVIGLSTSVPGDRFRLSLGHEVGHLLVHTRRTDNTESEANRFAAALLIPQAEFEAAMPERPQLRDFIELKKQWGVSVAALVYRAHELGHVDDARYRSLQIQMSNWRREEPATFPLLPGQLLRKLIETNGGTEAVATNLGMNRKHLAELVNWSHLRVA